MQPLRTVRRVVSRLRWRLKLQTAVSWATWALAIAALGILVCLFLFQIWVLGPSALPAVLMGAAGVVALGFVAGLLRPFDSITLAARLDAANALHDRLGTALLILKRPEAERTEFEQAQVRDAMRHADRARHQPAAPWRFPREIGWALAVSVVLLGVSFLRFGPPVVPGAAIRQVVLPDLLSGLREAPKLPPTAPVSDPETQAAVAEEVAQNTEELAALTASDTEAKAFVSELNKTLKALAEGQVNDREILERAGELERQLDTMAGTAAEKKQYEDTRDNLSEVGEALAQEAATVEKQAARKKDPALSKVADEAKQVAEMLQKEQYEMASKKLEALLEMFNKLSPKQQERLAKMFEKLARKFQSKLGKKLDRLRKKRSRLQRKMSARKDGGSKQQRRRLNTLNKQLDRLNRREQAGSGQKQKQLDRLSREMRKLSDRLRRKEPKRRGQKGQKGKKQEQKSRAQQKRSRIDREQMKRLSEQLKRMGKQQRRRRLQRQGKMRLADMKELMRRRRHMKRGKGRKQLERLARGKRGGKKKGGKAQAGKESTQERGVEWMKLNEAQKREFAKMRGASTGEGAGHGRKRMLEGKATELSAHLKDDFLAGKHGKGASIKEVIYGAAKQGTQVKGYGKAVIDYSMQAAEQMAHEQVPPGYREYVEQYFELIRKR